MTLDQIPEADRLPRHLSKQEFGGRLSNFIVAKKWNQSDLARAAGLPRDSISTYVRGKVLPTPKSLRAMADALGVSPIDLLPNAVVNAITSDVPSVEMRVSVSSPDMAWLRINRLLTFETATKVIGLVNADAKSRVVPQSDC